MSASKFTFFNIGNAYLYPFLASLEVELVGNIAIKKATKGRAISNSGFVLNFRFSVFVTFR
jgi:hypothetical protein